MSTSACFFFFYKRLGIQRGASTEALFKRFLSFLDYKSLMGFGFGVVKVPMVLMDLTPLSSRVFLGFLFQVSDHTKAKFVTKDTIKRLFLI